MKDQGEHTEPRPLARWIERRFGGFYTWLAAFAAFSFLALIVCDVSMWFLAPGYDPIAQTISDLAAGPHSWVQDAGIILFALGILALAAGLILLDDPDRRSWLVRICLMLLAADLLLLALRNEYGDGDTGGLVIHDPAAGLMALLVAIVLWFAPPPQHKRLTAQTRALAVVWLMGAVTLEFAPDDWEGLIERVLMLILGAAVLAAAWRLHEKARALGHSGDRFGTRAQ